MSSPDREKERELLQKIDDFAQKHNEKRRTRGKDTPKAF